MKIECLKNKGNRSVKKKNYDVKHFKNLHRFFETDISKSP